MLNGHFDKSTGRYRFLRGSICRRLEPVGLKKINAWKQIKLGSLLAGDYYSSVNHKA